MSMMKRFFSRPSFLLKVLVALICTSVYFTIKSTSVLDGSKHVHVRCRKTTVVNDTETSGASEEHRIHHGETAEDAPLLVVVMARWRFGSSILGELFNQNGNLFYMFEPLFATAFLQEMKDFTPQSTNIHREILCNITKCEFSPAFLRVMNEWPGRVKNKAICKNNLLGCRSVSAEWQQDLCAKYKGKSAAKVIRANLELLQPLVVEDGINLKIVHLVRDPRGSAASRIRYEMIERPKADDVKKIQEQGIPAEGRLQPLGLLDKPHKDTIARMCRWIRNNVRLSPEALPPWLKGRYHLVRYEDFADAPLRVTKKIYDFVGIPLPTNVREWLYANTHADLNADGAFTMRRNSKSTATAWRKSLTKVEIEQVEAECSDVIEKLGYKLNQ